MNTQTSTPHDVNVRTWTIPALDVLHQDGTYKILVDLPGVAAGDVHITREPGGLLLTATRRDQPERGYKRRLAVPHDLDAEDVDAVLADGVLALTLKPRQRTPRTIPVREA